MTHFKNKQMMKPGKTAGFTLIELLVVVAIIGLLAALLFPVLNVALEKTKRAACKKQIQQIVLAMQTFAIDNDGFFPLKSGTDYDDPYDNNGNLNRQFPLQSPGGDGVVREMYNSGILRDLAIWKCPSDRGEGANNSTEVTVSDDIETFNSFGNCSYMYVAGLNDRMSLNASKAVVILDEAWRREQGNRTPGNMPDIDEIDNHGDDYRNVAYYDGSARAVEGEGVSNELIFPEDDNAWHIVDDPNDRYGIVNSID